MTRQCVGRYLAALLTSMLLATACAAPPRPELTEPATTEPPSFPTDQAAPETPAPAPTVPAVNLPTAASLCAGSDPNDTGPLPRPELDEISGIARASTLGGFWMHMDGPDNPGVWAIGDDLSDRGFVGIEVDGIRDFEDMAMSRRGPWPQLIVADIGDNRRERDSVSLVAIDEPFPNAPPAQPSWRLVLQYPDGPRDAETLLVDDEAGYLVIVTKEEIRKGDSEEFDALPSRIYQTPLPQPGDPIDPTPRQLEFVGEIDTPTLASDSWDTRLHPLGLFGRAGSVTGGDVSPAGRLVAIRTYGTIWMWDRPAGTLVSDALLGQPCEAPAAFEIQGEALTFVSDTDWATIGERSGAELNVTSNR